MCQCWKGLSIAMMLLVAPLGGASPAGGQSEEGNSFRSWNFPDRYIRHRAYLGRIARSSRPTSSDGRTGRSGSFRVSPASAARSSRSTILDTSCDIRTTG